MVTKFRVSANTLGLTIAAVVTAAIFFLNGCNTAPHVNTPSENLAEGQVLSQKYCASCHRYPDPTLLDKLTWEQGVLPKMAGQLGIQQEMGQYYLDKKSLINLTDWQRIIDFYKHYAPQKLAVPKQDALIDWAMFSARRPAKVDRKGSPAMTSMISFNRLDGKLYTGDAAGNLLRWDASLNSVLVSKMPSSISFANFYKATDGSNAAAITCMGILPPNDELKGGLQQLNLTDKSAQNLMLADSLPRPVFTATGDFNKDGLMDYVICGYGNTKGALMLLEQQDGGKYHKRIIRQAPGAIQIETGDFNNDGWPDIICLFAQADEGVWMFLNDKHGGFTTRNLLRLPPVYGTNSFQLVDMDDDGQKDIVYTCGDNNDYSNILKPYHGVYIFTNQGNWKFKKTWFHHVNGASKVMAADFNGDGRQDMIVAAFFADFKYYPTEGLTYFEQTAANRYQGHQIPVNKMGRWISMEVADIDADGDQDVVLGNFSIYFDRLINQQGYKPDWDMYEPIIILENKTKHK